MLGDLRKIDFVQILSKCFFISGNAEIFHKVKTCKQLFARYFLSFCSTKWRCFISDLSQYSFTILFLYFLSQFQFRLKRYIKHSRQGFTTFPNNFEACQQQSIICRIFNFSSRLKIWQNTISYRSHITFGIVKFTNILISFQMLVSLKVFSVNRHLQKPTSSGLTVQWIDVSSR